MFVLALELLTKFLVYWEFALYFVSCAYLVFTFMATKVQYLLVVQVYVHTKT